MDHLAEARECLAIAESGDAKREAYKRAADHIAAHREATGESLADIAVSIERSLPTLKKLDQWRRSGFEAATPFLMDEKATSRAAQSHAKAVLRDPEQRKAAIESLDDDERHAVMQDIAQAPPKDEKTRKATRRQHDDDFAEAAAKATRKAFDGLSARVNFYADVPLTEHEKFHLEMIEKLLAILLRGASMDDELREILDESAAA